MFFFLKKKSPLERIKITFQREGIGHNSYPLQPIEEALQIEEGEALFQGLKQGKNNLINRFSKTQRNKFKL
jgi:hypothetical protein